MKATRAKPAPRPLPLTAIVAAFLDEVDQTLAPSTLRSYRIPLDLYLRHLRTTLDREPTLPDLNLETARAWMTYLRTAHKHQSAGQQEGDQPITLASLRNYLRHLRALANWLAKPPQGCCADSPLKYLRLPRGEARSRPGSAALALRGARMIWICLKRLVLQANGAQQLALPRR